jgi:hypothetical protein
VGQRPAIKGAFVIIVNLVRPQLTAPESKAMRPLSAVTLIILGSCCAITFSLTAVIIMFLVLGDDYPRLQDEFVPLRDSLFIFLGMTAISASSFYTLAKKHAARYWAQAAMWAGLIAVGYYYWP